MSSIDIVLVSYRTDKEVERLMRDFKSMTGCPYSLFVFDNTGNPKTLSIAWNDLAAIGNREYIAFLNPDIAVSPGWGLEMTSYLKTHPELGVVLPTPFASGRSIKFGNGQIMEGNFGSPPTDKEMGEVANKFKPFQTHGIHHDYCGFYAVVMRRTTWQILKGFDERFTFYGQDHDFQDRMKDLKLFSATLRFVPFWTGDSISTRRAISSREFDMKKEFEKTNEVFKSLREGKMSRWHTLSDEERASVRKNSRYNKIDRP